MIDRHHTPDEGKHRMRKMFTSLAALVAVLGTFLVASPAQAATTYHYAVGRQANIVADGAAVNLTTEDPYLNAAHDGTFSHSLAELAVFSTDRKDRIELGWRKQAGGVPQLFSYHTVNGVNGGYNACTDYSSEPYNMGSAIPSTMLLNQDNPRFQIIHSGSVWWMAFNLKYVCYLPDTLWTSQGRTFTKVNDVQAYGELASTTTNKPCGDIGNGTDATSASPARIGSYSLQGQTSGTAPVFTVTTTPAGAGITASVVTATTFTYGWKGYNAAGTGLGITGGC